MSVAPTEISGDILLTIGNMSGSYYMGGIWGAAENGKTFAAPDGDRFIYCIAGGSVLYLQLSTAKGHEWRRGRFFTQGAQWFKSDVTQGAVGQKVAEMTAGTKSVMQAWLDLYMGAMACAGGPTGWAIKGFSGLITAGKVYQNYAVYKKAIEVLLYNQEIFRTRTPNLYGYVLAEVIYGHLKNMLTGKVKEKVAEGLAGPVAGKFVGVFMEKIGEDQFKLALTTISSLFREVLIKVAQHTYDNPTAKLSESQIELLGNHVNKQLKPLGRVLPRSITDKIITEAAYGNIRSSLIKLADAADAL